MIIRLPADTDPATVQMIRDVLSVFSRDPRVHAERERRWADEAARGKRIDALLTRATELLDAAGRARSPKRFDALLESARDCRIMAEKIRAKQEA